MTQGPRPGSRQRGRLRAIVLALGLGSVGLGVVLAPSDAAGDKAGAAPGRANKPVADGGRYDPEGIRAISEFTELTAQGSEKLLANNFPAAIILFKKAIQLAPLNPMGSYLLGEAYLASGNFAEAEAAFKTAELLDATKQPLLRSHILFALAECYEREQKRDLAKTAWQAYIELAAKIGPDAGAYPQSGAARIKALDDWLKLDGQYEIVRKRIAAAKAEAGAPDASKPPK